MTTALFCDMSSYSACRNIVLSQYSAVAIKCCSNIVLSQYCAFTDKEKHVESFGCGSIQEARPGPRTSTLIGYEIIASSSPEAC